MPASLKISALAAAAALTVALASCSTGGVSPASSSSVSMSHKPLSALKQQARREHGLVIYGNVPPQYFQAVFAAFHKQYPFIKVSETALDDHAVFTKYEAEAAQGARTADLLIASAPAAWVQGDHYGVSAGVTPAGLSAFPPWVNQGHGVFIMSAEPILLVYSPKLLTPAQVPHTWARLAADTDYSHAIRPIRDELDVGDVEHDVRREIGRGVVDFIENLLADRARIDDAARARRLGDDDLT